MTAPEKLRRLDDRFLRGDGMKAFLKVAAKVSALVLTALALVLVAAIVLVVAPTNEDNVLVRGVLDTAAQVAGPFATVFDMDNRSARAASNYGLGAAVYLLAARLVRRLA